MLLVAAALAGCMGGGTPREVEISAARLQELVARNFPFERRVFEVLEVRVDAPRLTLLPEANRIAVVLDMRAFERISGTTHAGSMATSAALRYEPGDRTLRLVDVRVERVDVGNLAGAWQRTFDDVARRLIGGVLEGRAVYTVDDPLWQRMQERGVEPGAIRVTGNGVAIALQPLAR